MKLQLINSPLPLTTSGCLRSSCYPPLNLISLGTYVTQTSNGVDVQILDGEIIGMDGVIGSLNADVYGISSNSISYESAVVIGEYIKRRDPRATVALGGAHATNFAGAILRHRKCFDHVVVGQGEAALLEIVGWKARQAVHSMGIRSLHRAPRLSVTTHPIAIGKLPPPDYSLVDITPYNRNFKLHYPTKGRFIGLPLYSSFSCDWRFRSGGCIYCSIPASEPSRISGAQFWNEVLRLRDSYGADFIWDISDTFTSSREWLRSLALTKPESPEVVFHVYVRAGDIDMESVRLLDAIGVQEVMIGVESFDSRMLHNARKGISRKRMDLALNLLNENGIRVAISFVLGLPGESEDSLKVTLDHLSEISWMNNIIENHASVIIPR